jgi:4-amino-4-deoxy-L-arabinose transferase-like glycosyltransferase
MSSFPTSSPAAEPSWRRDALLLIVIFSLLLGFQLGRPPLANPDEGRYAEIPREMLATGDWVTPRLDGVNYFEKPPLLYWTVAVAQAVFGPAEWVVRLTPAVCALGGILLTYAAARRFHGRMAGVIGSGVLGTSLLYFGTGRFLVLDMMVSVLMAATLVCFLCGVFEPPGRKRRLLFYGLYASAALATLTKGFIGFLVTGAVMFLWLLVFNQWKRLRPLHLPTGLLLFLALALPWHVLAAQRNETWAHRYILFEHWERFTTTQHGRVQPWHFFLWILLAGLFPWTPFLFRGVRDAVRGGWAKRDENAVGWFLLVWIGFVLAFFSISQSKLPAYILPVFPAVAVLIGASLARVVRDGTVRLRGEFLGYAAFCALLGVAIAVAVLKPGLIRDASQAAALRPCGIALAALLLAAATVVPQFAAKRGARIGLVAVGGVAALFLLLLSTATGEIQKPGTKALALRVRAAARPEDRVVHFGEFFHDFTYYARRLVDVAGTKGELEFEEDPAAPTSGRFYDRDALLRHWSGPQRIWLVTRKRDLKELTRDPAFRYQLLAETRDHYLLTNLP